MRYVLKVAYDGTDFCGWQIQPNKRTVQGEIENAIFTAFGARAKVCGSGRTDSGVHALSQVAHVDLDVNIRPEKLADALNVHLPQDVSVLSSSAAADGFDANRTAKKKTYCYQLYCSARRNPLLERYAVRVDGAPDINAMREAAEQFVGEHDFKAYCASGSQVKTTVRTIFSLNVLIDKETIKIEVCGNGFLYNMVRTIAGTLLWHAYGKLTLEDIARSLESGNRALAGKTLPPKGLVLKSVEY